MNGSCPAEDSSWQRSTGRCLGVLDDKGSPLTFRAHLNRIDSAVRGMADKVANSSTDYERLRLLFRRSASLPPLPCTALRLVEAIDSGEASAIQLERIIISDPPLAANVLALANVDLGNGNTTIRHAIMNLGQRAIRSSAMSFTIRNLVRSIGFGRELSQNGFFCHSLATAFISKYLLGRMFRTAPEVVTTWTADEVFASALLHDISKPLLAGVDLDALERTCLVARRNGAGIDETFITLYGASLRELGAEALKAWRLPEVFSLTQEHLDQPWRCPSEVDSLICIAHADYLATTVCNLPLEPWPVERAPLPEASMNFELSEQELQMLSEQVSAQVQLLEGVQAA